MHKVSGLGLAAHFISQDTPEYQAKVLEPIRELERKQEALQKTGGRK